jgi:lipoprotein-anchoring transpeptidase ErfK/SrfK
MASGFLQFDDCRAFLARKNSEELERIGMRAAVWAAVAAAAGLAVVSTTMVKAEYNPGVQVRYDALGNPIEGPGITPTTSSGSGGGRNYTPIPREIVDYKGSNAGKGNIVINTAERRLYLMLGDGKALRYGIGVGRPGFTWGGTHSVTRKAEWPGWTPPQEMREREAAKGKILPAHMEGGPENPLGARALYLGESIYRIHGTNQPWTIGKAVSSGCIRMRNEDVIDLYERVGVGAKVIVS